MADPSLVVLVRRARAARLARIVAAIMGVALGLCIIAGVRVVATASSAAAPAGRLRGRVRGAPPAMMEGDDERSPAALTPRRSGGQVASTDERARH